MIQARAAAVLLTAGLLLPVTAPLSPTSALLSAPAPRPRPPRPLTRSDLVGVWRATFGDLPTVIELRPDGRYWCDWASSPWHGSWALIDGDLLISERPAADDSPRESTVLRFRRLDSGEWQSHQGIRVRLLERVRHLD